MKRIDYIKLLDVEHMAVFLCKADVLSCERCSYQDDYDECRVEINKKVEYLQENID